MSKIEKNGTHLETKNTRGELTAKFCFLDDFENKVVFLEYVFEQPLDRLSCEAAIQSAIVYGFDQLNFEKLNVEVSQKDGEILDMFRAAGFRVEGVFKRHIYDGGKYLDLRRLALSKRDRLESLKNTLPNIKVGSTYSERIKMTKSQIKAFAELTGDSNPLHLDDGAAQQAGFVGAISHGFLLGSVFSRILGTRFPGQGTVYIGQTLNFKKPAYPGMELNVSLKVLTKVGRRLVIETSIADSEGTLLLDGEADVLISHT